MEIVMPPREDEVGANTVEAAKSPSAVDFTRRDSVESMLMSLRHCEDDDHCMRPSDLKELRLLEGNDACIDCGKMEPEWACISLGIFLCLQCSGHHRYVN